MEISTASSTHHKLWIVPLHISNATQFSKASIKKLKKLTMSLIAVPHYCESLTGGIKGK